MENDFLTNIVNNCKTNFYTEIPLKDLVDFDVSKLINNPETTQLAGKLSLTQLLEYSLPRQNGACDASDAQKLADSIAKQLTLDIGRFVITINGSRYKNINDYNTKLDEHSIDEISRYKIIILSTQTLYNVLSTTILDFLKKYLHKKITGSVKNVIINIVFKNNEVIVYVTAEGNSSYWIVDSEIPLPEKFFLSMSFNITKDTYSITQLSFSPQIMGLLGQRIKLINFLKDLNTKLKIQIPIPIDDTQPITKGKLDKLYPGDGTLYGYTVEFSSPKQGIISCESKIINPSQLLSEIRKQMQEQPKYQEQLNQLIEDIETENALCIDNKNKGSKQKQLNIYSFNDFDGPNIKRNGLYNIMAPSFDPATFFRFVKKVWPQIKEINSPQVNLVDPKRDIFFTILQERKKQIENNSSQQKDPSDPYDYGLTVRTIKGRCRDYDFAIPNKEWSAFLQGWQKMSPSAYEDNKDLIAYISKERSNCNNSNFLTRGLSYTFSRRGGRKTKRRKVQKAKRRTKRYKNKTHKRR